MRLSEHCYAVLGLGYVPPWTVNAGFVAGEHTTLIIDTSANALGAATIHGYAIAVRPANRVFVLNTEKHFDHVGGNSYYRSRGIDIYGHPDCARTAAEFTAELSDFSAAMPNRNRRAAREEAIFYRDSSPAGPTLPLTEAARIDLGGIEAHVIPTPGHTGSNVSVWIPTDRVVYTGDCLISEYMPNLDCGEADEWKQWLESLEKLEQLGATTAVTGHGPVLADVSLAITRVRGFLERALSRTAVNKES